MSGPALGLNNTTFPRGEIGMCGETEMCGETGIGALSPAHKAAAVVEDSEEWSDDGDRK